MRSGFRRPEGLRFHRRRSVPPANPKAKGANREIGVPRWMRGARPGKPGRQTAAASRRTPQSAPHACETRRRHHAKYVRRASAAADCAPTKANPRERCPPALHVVQGKKAAATTAKPEKGHDRKARTWYRGTTRGGHAGTGEMNLFRYWRCAGSLLLCGGASFTVLQGVNLNERYIRYGNTRR
jgi:hypothetical protein